MFFKMDPGPLIGFCLTAITRFLMDFGIVRKIKMAATGKKRLFKWVCRRVSHRSSMEKFEE